MVELNFSLRVNCMTYNHASFIEEAMDGFCIQKTSFPFVCTICDDYSTDGEQEIIKNYLELHFEISNNEAARFEETDDYLLTFAQHKDNKNCFFAVYLLKYNHYSIRKPKKPYFSIFDKSIKYIAICEGDDYWIDPMKLQKQISFLQSNPNCSMVCNRTLLFSQKDSKFHYENRCKKKSSFLNTKDIIRKGGLYISSCSIIYRKTIITNLPDYFIKCHVGDYPLQIKAALQGRVYYFDSPMSVYRIDNIFSWVGRKSSKSLESNIKGIVSEVNMLKGFGNDHLEYKHFFKQRMNFFILWNIPNKEKKNAKDNSLYWSVFKEDIDNFSPFWKFYKKCILNKKSIPSRIFFKLFNSKYVNKLHKLE